MATLSSSYRPLAVDALGDIYYADQADQTIRKVTILIRSSTLRATSGHAPYAGQATGSRLALAFALPGMPLAGLGARSRELHGGHRLVGAVVCLGGLAGMAGLTGCGSSSAPLYRTATAALGIYTFNVVATSGSTTTTLPTTVTVQ